MEEDLENFLLNSDLRQKLQSIISRVKGEYLRFWQVHAPHFTDHGENHCITIEMTLKEILDLEIASSLNEYEIFVLLSSVWLHDIGVMVQNTRAETDQEIRERHNERSREMIRSQFDRLLSFPERITIGDIAWAHSKQADITTLREIKTIRHPEIGNKIIRQQFLAALLRFFDALDLCHTRTSETVIAFSHLSDRSKFYHAIHCRVSGLIREETQILIDIDYSDEDEKSILSGYIVTPLNYELESVRNILARNNLVITAIEPRYNLVEGLDPLPSPPDTDLDSEVAIPESFKILQDKTEQFLINLRNGNVEKAQEMIDALVEEYSDDAVTWDRYSRFYSQEIYDEEKAHRGAQNARDIEPENTGYITNLGHFIGEYLYDLDGSFELFEQAYQKEPDNDLCTLNYTEALITKGRFEDANELAQNILQESSFLHWICLSKFFSFCSSCLIDNSLEDKYDESGFLFGLLQETNERGQPWTFRKIRHFLHVSEDVDPHVAEFLAHIINYFEDDISLEELLEIRDDLFSTE